VHGCGWRDIHFPFSSLFLHLGSFLPRTSIGAVTEEVMGDCVLVLIWPLFSIEPLPGGHDADREALLFELIFLIEREDE